ncbi:MAG: hypothetical protein FWD74_00715 [Actinomycetia bacterium]|nr:hypothetical protein [Actinomycetes bacterium]
MPHVPAPVRAALGLAAVAVDQAKTLPERAVQLPVLAAGSAMAAALRAHQRYAALTSRGDEVIARLRGAPEEPPEWATFDGPPAAAEGKSSAFDAVGDQD